MSILVPIPTPITGSSRKHQSTFATVIILVTVTAVGLLIVVGFILFVTWFRMEKRRE